MKKSKYGKIELNKKYNKLTVISNESKRKNHSIYYQCKCDCGNIKYIHKHSILSGSQKSCGCLNKRYGKLNPLWKGCGDISQKYWWSKKIGAFSRNLEFNITIEQIWNLFLEQNRKCALTGLDLKFNESSNSTEGNASLDRKDSSKGYTIDNIQWVHKDINYLKLNLSEEKLFELCKLVVLYKKLL